MSENKGLFDTVLAFVNFIGIPYDTPWFKVFVAVIIVGAVALAVTESVCRIRALQPPTSTSSSPQVVIINNHHHYQPVEKERPKPKHRKGNGQRRSSKSRGRR